ncbi:MAG: hypothetical protein R3B96_07580 [Pirellulaceae bacterium]
MNQEWPQRSWTVFSSAPLRVGVAWAEPELLRRINRAVEAGTLVNRIGVAVEEPMWTRRLVDKESSSGPSVLGSIPTLLPDEAIFVGRRPGNSRPRRRHWSHWVAVRWFHLSNG